MFSISGHRLLGWIRCSRIFLRVWLVVLGVSGGVGADLEEAWLKYRQGDLAGCLALADRAVKDGEYEEDWHWLRVEGYFLRGEYLEAYGAVTNSMEILPRSVRLRWQARQIFPYAGRVAETSALVREVIELVERRPWSYRGAADRVVVGRAALALGADPKSVLDRLYEPAKAADAECRDVYLGMGALALDKRDFQLASKLYQEGLEKLPGDPDLCLGMGRAFAPSDRAKALEWVRRGLEVNPRHGGSLRFLAEHEIDREAYDAAEEILGRVRTVNPYDPEAWALLWVIAHLRNQPDLEGVARGMALKFWESNPAVVHLVGRKLSEKYRFAEGASLQQEALAFDAGYRPAQSQLALDLLRLGRDREGWKLAEQIHEADEYDVAALNLVTLKDVLEDYTVLTNGMFRVRMEAGEARLYGDRVLRLLARAESALAAKYGLELTEPVAVEVFAEQKDFAVRTFGMPENHGFLGVCFGPVITANSPGARPGLRFNWESMLWHEFCHVVTLQLTRNKMPRWLSEGISVYEERQADPAWGEHWTPEYVERVTSGRMSRIGEMSGAFLNATSPGDLEFAYFQSSLVVEFLVERYGLEQVREVLGDLGRGDWINVALERRMAPLEELDGQFREYVRGQVAEFCGGLDFTKPPLDVLVAAGRAGSGWTEWAAGRTNNVWVILREASGWVDDGEWQRAVERLEGLVGRVPGLVDGQGPWALLAEAYRGMEDIRGERRVLEDWAARLDDGVDVYARLMELQLGASDWGGVLGNVERYLAVDPLVPLAYRLWSIAAEGVGDAEGVVAANRRLLLLDPPNPAEVNYRLAKALNTLGEEAARRHLLDALQDAPGNREALQLLLDMRSAERRVDGSVP